MCRQTPNAHVMLNFQDQPTLHLYSLFNQIITMRHLKSHCRPTPGMSNLPKSCQSPDFCLSQLRKLVEAGVSQGAEADPESAAQHDKKFCSGACTPTSPYP